MERVLAFMADAVAESRGRTTVIWKSISCSPATIPTRSSGLPGRQPSPSGVDALLLVFTHSAQRSARFQSDNRHELLQLVPRAIVSTTPVQQRLDRHGLRHPPTAWGQLRENGRRYRGLLHSIDELQLLFRRADFHPRLDRLGWGRPWTDWRCAATAGRWDGRCSA